MTAVLDASFLSRSLVRSQQLQGAADALRALVLRGEILRAPVLLEAEFLSTVRRLERRGRIEADEVGTALGSFRSLPLRYGWRPAWPATALQIARRHNQSTIYDAIYLACAEDFDAQLYTCDEAFARSFGRDVPPRLNLVGAAGA